MAGQIRCSNCQKARPIEQVFGLNLYSYIPTSKAEPFEWQCPECGTVWVLKLTGTVKKAK